MFAYTLVQHSGLDNAVMKKGIEAKTARIVRNKGGVVIEDFTLAGKAEMAANYGEDNSGIHPDCTDAGYFSEHEVYGSRLFIPAIKLHEFKEEDIPNLEPMAPVDICVRCSCGYSEEFDVSMDAYITPNITDYLTDAGWRVQKGEFTVLYCPECALKVSFGQDV